jgi:5S rRNA maturation endonuclease (ribonuclease M5)
MEIRNEFNKEEIGEIAQQIYLLIKNEKKLTNRRVGEIKNLLRDKGVVIAFDRNRKITGFIIKRKLYKNYYEVMSWYIDPVYRGKGNASKLIKKITSNKNQIYFSATTQEQVVNIVKKYGFRKGSLSNLPLMVIIKYLITRSHVSLFNYLFKKKSYFLFK